MSSERSALSLPSLLRELGRLSLAGLVLLLIAFVFAPATVYLFNGDEVTTSVAEVLRNAGLAPWGLLLAIVLIGAVSGKCGRRILASAVLSLAALLYLQGNLFVWDYGVFDGTDMDWSRHRLAGWLEAMVWCGLLVAALVRRQWVWRNLVRLGLVVVVLGAASLGAHLLTGRDFSHATASGIDDRLYRFSSRQNVLVLVMDAFSSPAFDRILADDSSWRERLSGFTYYQDALGVAPTTLPSIPAILSGRTNDNSRTVDAYLRDSLYGRSLPKLLQENGFLTHTITETVYGKYLTDVPYASQISFLDRLPQDRARRDALRIWNVALFRHAPHFLKPRVYADGRWLLRAGVSGADDDSAPEPPYIMDETHRVPSPGQRASWVLWRELLAKAATGSRRPTFKFIHTFDTHSPFFLAADCTQITQDQYAVQGAKQTLIDQSICALNQVLELCGKLREIGVYDETLIILTADHGSHTRLLGDQRARDAWGSIPGVDKVLPLLLVKPMGGSGALQVSQAPVSLLDIPGTITSAVGLGGAVDGLALDAIAVDRPRTREYYDYTWEHSFWWEDYLPPLTRYTVTGPVRNPESWSEGVALPTGGRE